MARTPPRFVRHLRGTSGRRLHGIEVAAVTEPVDVGRQQLVDLHQNKRFLDLFGPVGGDTVEAGRHGIPIAAEIAVHEPGTVAEPPQRIA